MAVATVAAATARGEVVAWLDLADALDPASATAAGVDLARVLWVRPRGVEDAVRAAELVLEVGGFTVVVLDLGAGARGVPGAETRLGGARRRGRGALRLRLARAVERAGVVTLVLADRPWVGTLAGVTVVLERGGVRWDECGGARWLSGISLRARVERGRAGDNAPARESSGTARVGAPRAAAPESQTGVIARPQSGRSNPEAIAMASGSPRLPRCAREPRDDSLGAGAAFGA
jgi:hypothetical protein